ncbi:carboxymuconolactone decarboxylase family protein [Aquisphaera insulae]|uniref:carboxymuconolactone decarboxylase family protein n=1 Tax=Aquisphaera insulae TaxID=2712864 RepID=UPI0013EBD660|nr:carboxymuconolactone decarboxylase family protein [Aquisphaera insulae]
MPESQPPVATVRPVDPSEATGKVAEIFEDIKRTKNIDFVPRFWQVIASNPTQLEVVWTSLKTIMHPEAVGRTPRLDAVTREIIAVAVSATNGCNYCVNSHTTALKKLGLDAEAIGEMMAVVGLFNMTNAMANGYQIEPDVRPKWD